MKSLVDVPFPRVVRIEPAGACNLRCRHCPTGTIEMKRGIMNDEVFGKIVENINKNIDFVKVIVLYHGGEPFMNKNFYKMLRELKNLNIPNIKTVTNGMLLTDEIITQIISEGLDEIEFSLDGLDPKQNNYIRRGCNYDEVAKNIKKLIDMKKKLGSSIPRISISSTQFIQNKGTDTSTDVFVPEYIKKEFNQYVPNEIVSFKVNPAMKWPEMDIHNEDFEIIDLIKNENISNYCDNVYNTITIRWNGNIVPCCYDLTEKSVMGNVIKDSMIEVWNSKQYKELRKSIENKEFIDLCSGCNVVKPGVYLSLRNNSMIGEDT